MIGETILHYKIIEKLGEGGMGEVYKAQDTKLDRFVALKFLPSQMTASEEDKARFIQEAKAASAMNHPNVCTIYDIQESNGQLFIVMEFVDGKTLKDVVETHGDASLPTKQILEIGIQVAEGLAAAHEKGIVHRDIKPENIMIRKDDIAQIMDFGLAKLYKDSNVSRLTKTGTTMGTMRYMSPEQAQGLDVDHRTDIFSLGVVLYELLAGELPFKGIHEPAIMYEIVNVDAPHLSSIKESIDPKLDEVILECLEKDKDERCQSAKELARNLRRLKRTSTGSRTASRIQQAIPAERENKKKFEQVIKRLKIGIITLAVLFIAVIVWNLFIQRSAKPGINLSAYHYTPFETDGVTSQGIWSPDGKSIAFTKAVNGKSELRVRSLGNPESALLTVDEDIFNPFWSPNGNKIYYFAKGNIGILKSIGLAGGNQNTILPFHVWAAAISPDNKTLAFWTLASNVDSAYGDSTTLFISDLHGKGARRYLPAPFKVGGGPHPVFMKFSPDGSKIAITNYTKGGLGFWILPWPAGSGTKPRKIFTDRKFSIEVPPYFNWLPDSRHIVLSFDNGIWVGDTKDETLTRITSSQRGENLSSVSPNGKRILMGVSNTNYDIVELPFDGLPLKPVIATSVNEKSATVSKDGKDMTYITDRTGENEIWLRKEDGTEYPIVTDADFPSDSGRIYSAAISPNGKHVAYRRSAKKTISELWVSNSEGGKPVLLSPDSVFVEDFCWSPDSKRLLATFFNFDKTRSVILPIGNGETVQLPDSEVSNGLPAWSPDGKWIALKQEKRILLISPDGKQSKTLIPPVNPSAWNYCMCWSRDSRKLYIASSVEKISKLYVIDVRTGKSQKIAEYGYNVTFGQNFIGCSTASISDDGKGLVVSAQFASGSLYILDGALRNE